MNRENFDDILKQNASRFNIQFTHRIRPNSLGQLDRFLGLLFDYTEFSMYNFCVRQGNVQQKTVIDR